MSSIDYFLSSIQGNANKRDYVKKYVITFSFVYDIIHKRQHASKTYLQLHNFFHHRYTFQFKTDMANNII